MLLIGAAALAGCSAPKPDPRRERLGANPTEAALRQAADARIGAQKFGRCAQCHTIEPGAGHRAGPNLAGVMGAPIAGDGSYGYTAALRSVAGSWTWQAMNAWLTSPQRFAPGNKMAYPGVTDPLDRADLIAYLEENSKPGR